MNENASMYASLFKGTSVRELIYCVDGEITAEADIACATLHRYIVYIGVFL